MLVVKSNTKSIHEWGLLQNTRRGGQRRGAAVFPGPACLSGPLASPGPPSQRAKEEEGRVPPQRRSPWVPSRCSPWVPSRCSPGTRRPTC